MPVWNVLGGGSERILRLCSSEARVLNSRERVGRVARYGLTRCLQTVCGVCVMCWRGLGGVRWFCWGWDF